MIDGIKLSSSIDDFEKWKAQTNLSFNTYIDISSGQVNTKNRGNKSITKHKCKWEHLDLCVTEVDYYSMNTKEYYLRINGSLHKNHFDGTNFQRFSWDDLQKQLRHITQSLFLSPELTTIQNIEIGVNLETEFKVSPFLNNNILCFKGKDFKKYRRDDNGNELGLYSDFSQYDIKMYDKGIQFKLPIELLRFEKRFRKMQPLKQYGISHLSDLFNREKIQNLKNILINSWKDVLIQDIDSLDNIKQHISDSEYQVLLEGSGRNFWGKSKLNNLRKSYFLRKKFSSLVDKYGQNYKLKILKLIEVEWENHFKDCTNLPCGEESKLYNLTVKINGNNLHLNDSVKVPAYCIPYPWDGLPIVNYNKKQLYAI